MAVGNVYGVFNQVGMGWDGMVRVMRRRFRVGGRGRAGGIGWGWEGREEEKREEAEGRRGGHSKMAMLGRRHPAADGLRKEPIFQII